ISIFYLWNEDLGKIFESFCLVMKVMKGAPSSPLMDAIKLKNKKMSHSKIIRSKSIILDSHLWIVHFVTCLESCAFRMHGKILEESTFHGTKPNTWSLGSAIYRVQITFELTTRNANTKIKGA
ncbi:hypothetical protein M8C21_023657, partial [Ambrosia artemisiifolia]